MSRTLVRDTDKATSAGHEYWSAWQNDKGEIQDFFLRYAEETKTLTAELDGKSFDLGSGWEQHRAISAVLAVGGSVQGNPRTLYVTRTQTDGRERILIAQSGNSLHVEPAQAEWLAEVVENAS